MKKKRKSGGILLSAYAVLVFGVALFGGYSLMVYFFQDKPIFVDGSALLSPNQEDQNPDDIQAAQEGGETGPQLAAATGAPKGEIQLDPLQLVTTANEPTETDSDPSEDKKIASGTEEQDPARSGADPLRLPHSEIITEPELAAIDNESEDTNQISGGVEPGGGGPIDDPDDPGPGDGGGNDDETTSLNASIDLQIDSTLNFGANDNTLNAGSALYIDAAVMESEVPPAEAPTTISATVETAVIVANPVTTVAEPLQVNPSSGVRTSQNLSVTKRNGKVMIGGSQGSWYSAGTNSPGVNVQSGSTYRQTPQRSVPFNPNISSNVSGGYNSVSNFSTNATHPGSTGAVTSQFSASVPSVVTPTFAPNTIITPTTGGIPGGFIPGVGTPLNQAGQNLGINLNGLTLP